MGWSRGSQVMEGIITALQPHMPDAEARQGVYEILIECFEDMDWDTQSECLKLDPAFDAAFKAMHPDWYAEIFPEATAAE